ncbi:MAG: cobyrinate a,c-diamide synthase [Proteobacteria bacterium]|nr:cobyrinate a,c-diamide synthase [Pseudomonadota bacterium]MBU1386387.1 cobyrinate a,c-diamide synthase [Pseudomonadota bacterium]MBU1544498.1 cobyrinate a,c-diamide synthase [Pseudomonadota bacterium]
MQGITTKKPGIVIAGLGGGSGKTVISIGIAAAWKNKGLKVSVFKKGPDYIDAGWLSKAAGCPCYNLDTFLCDPDVVVTSYLKNSSQSEICVIEGNRGLYDGIDTNGSTSTAELAKLLKLPVLLVLDCTKSTRTMAALLMGCIAFDPDIQICGVILNRVAGKRHEGKVRANIEKYCNVPVFGAIPKLTAEDFPERHMGLVTSDEHQFSDTAITAAVKVAEENIDLDALYRCVLGQNTQDSFQMNENAQSCAMDASDIVIGVIKDSAFQFYYPDNIDALEKSGATIIYISPLTETTIPGVHAIYMGGGFPETHAPQLAQNELFKKKLKELSLSGLPIYAECGGLIFLGTSIRLDGVDYPMSDILPIRFGMSKRPQGHGYTKVEVVHDNPFYQKGEILKGHEFRYSSVLDIDYQDFEMAFKMERGKGILNKKDGFFKNNTFGTYTHIHALGSHSWAPSLVRKAAAYKALIH